MEKLREVRRADVDALIDGIAGVVLTHLSSLPARCAPRGDLAIRRRIERVAFEMHTEVANQRPAVGWRMCPSKSLMMPETT